MKKYLFHVSLLSVFLLLFLLISCEPENPAIHPFEAFLAEVDPVYSYEHVHTITGDDYTAYILRMVSQKWLTEELVDETEWWHWLTIVVPDPVEHTTGMLWIGGGSKNNEQPGSVHPVALDAALATHSVTSYLHNVPFQPVTFQDDRLDERYEDDIIALGWSKFLEGGAKDEEVEWLSRLPMTKAAIRAMDTITEFTEQDLGLPVQDYVVTGASKRGWTTWATAAFDSRVVAIAPMVIDLLNMLPSFEHHWQAYGEWSPAIREYEDEGIMNWQHSREYERLRELVDPHSWLDHLTIPKYVINAASDEFFLPDSWQFYWQDLLGEKYLRYIPNSGHSLGETDAAVSFISFYSHILEDRELPAFDWNVDENGDGLSIQVDPENPPDEILLWNTHNPQGRDFRLYVIDRTWQAQTLEIPDDGELFVEWTAPDQGFTAWFLEATYGLDTPYPFKQTTGIVVTPDEYPFPPFRTENPRGTLSND